jgi:hypothetical protein
MAHHLTAWGLGFATGQPADGAARLQSGRRLSRKARAFLRLAGGIGRGEGVDAEANGGGQIG